MGASWYADYLDVRADLDRLHMGAAGKALEKAVLNSFSHQDATMIIAGYREAIKETRKGKVTFLSGIEKMASERREKARTA